eukprot:550979_1
MPSFPTHTGIYFYTLGSHTDLAKDSLSLTWSSLRRFGAISLTLLSLYVVFRLLGNADALILLWPTSMHPNHSRPNMIGIHKRTNLSLFFVSFVNFLYRDINN